MTAGGSSAPLAGAPAAAAALLLVGCGGGTAAPSAPSPPTPDPAPAPVVSPFSGDGLEERTIGGDRPATLFFPAGRTSEPLPLVINLHGYGSNGSQQDLYFGLSSRAAASGFAVVSPDGTRSARGERFWNATDYCCDLEGSGVDDAAYLGRLAREAEEFLTVSGVFVTGLSNGGFMSYRAACESGILPKLVGIMVVAGSSWQDRTRCASPAPVSVLHLHGTNDETILFEGWPPQGDLPGQPGAREPVRRWAERAGCDLSAPESDGPFDLDFKVPGAETTVTRYRRGCRGGRVFELWTMEGSYHVPDFGSGLGRYLADWIADRSR